MTDLGYATAVAPELDDVEARLVQLGPYVVIDAVRVPDVFAVQIEFTYHHSANCVHADDHGWGGGRCGCGGVRRADRVELLGGVVPLRSAPFLFPGDSLSFCLDVT